MSSLLAPYNSAILTLSNAHPVLGLALTTHRSTRGEPLSFADKPYLVELYADARDLERVVLRKAVQTGVSEWLLQVVLDAAGWRGRTCAYVLPSYKVRNRFVQGRVNKVLMEVPAYRDRCPGGLVSEAKDGAENLALKRFGRGALLFLGSETATDFVEFSADFLIVDEFDRCDLSNVAMAWDRLRESPFPQVVYVGNPTIPRSGISREFDDSDRRRWFHRCSRCGQRQAIDWFHHVVARDDAGRWSLRDVEAVRTRGVVRPVCERCRRPFDRVATGGSWVAEQPGHERRGYSMSRLDVLSDDLADLYAEWMRAQGSPDLVRAFYNGALGVPYEFEGARLSQENLDATTHDEDDLDHGGGESYGGHTVTAGIDVGSVLHVTISIVERDPQGRPVRRARYVGTSPTFEGVRDMLVRFRVDIAVIDAMPETHKAQELRDHFVEEGGTIVWLCRFHPTPRVGAQKYGMALDYGTQVVQVDRTAVFDVTHEDIVTGRRRFPGDVLGVVGWSEQMRAPVRVTDPDKGRIVWTEGSAADHYRLADCYDRIACDLLDLGGSYSSG